MLNILEHENEYMDKVVMDCLIETVDYQYLDGLTNQYLPIIIVYETAELTGNNQFQSQ